MLHIKDMPRQVIDCPPFMATFKQNVICITAASWLSIFCMLRFSINGMYMPVQVC